MKRARSLRPARVSTIARRKPRSRSAAAADLVRLEYERERLVRDIETLDQRRAEALSRLQKIQLHSERLQQMLTSDPMEDVVTASAHATP